MSVFLTVTPSPFPQRMYAKHSFSTAFCPIFSGLEGCRKHVADCKRHRTGAYACTQFCLPSGLIKLIKTSLVRASSWAFGELKGRPGIENTLLETPLLPEEPIRACSRISSRRTAKGKASSVFLHAYTSICHHALEQSDYHNCPRVAD